MQADNIPDPDADWDEIIKFAHTFDAYEHHGSFEAVADIAQRCAHDFGEGGELPHDVDTIQTALFFEVRAWRHEGYEPTEDEDRPYIGGLLQRLRELV